ncbi:MAG: cytochrome c [Myxococcota bacterium]|jgi:mono/diheme cytochrome c family protein|nr:cytochrome c [Myxococcota bacterium]
MNPHVIGIPAFGLAVLLVFAFFGIWVTDLQGQKSGGSQLSGDISAEAGREIFWGKGKCYTCHSIGGEGSAQRCPNLGTNDQFSDPIWVRAAVRKQSEGYSRERYIVESIYDPNAYVVEGFSKGLMKPINKPPIALTDDEITSVIAYLLTEAGANDAVPEDVMAAVLDAQRDFASAKVATEEFVPGMPVPEGDAEEGFYVFEEMKCHSCHKIDGMEFEAAGDAEGGVGPDLTGIGDIQTLEYLAESVMDPNAIIVAGDGFKGDDGNSKMPEFHDTMTLREFIDLVAFLSSLKAEG